MRNRAAACFIIDTLTWLAAARHCVHPIGACGNRCTGIATVASSITRLAACSCGTGKNAIGDCNWSTA